MAYSTLPIAGIDLTQVFPVGTVPTNGPLGMETFASDGKRYVLAEANASIAASTAVCDINATTFLVAATGGAYTSPATALVDGDVAWFAAASV